MEDSSRSNSHAISITLYVAGNESEICAFFERVFGGPKSVERWEWQFRENPYEGPQIALAHDTATGELVGHYAVIPVSINWLGRAVKAAQSVDTMVDSRYRGFGIFERTAHACYESLLKSQFEMLYGFPNRAALAARLRNLRWERLFTLPSYSTRLSCYEFLRRIAPLPGLPTAGDFIYRVFCSLRVSRRIAFARLRLRGFKFRRSNSVPSNYDTFWHSVKQSEIISVWKDRNYLTWRYDRCPDRQYEYFFLENGNREIAALCVVRISGDQFLLCELMAVNRNTRMAQYLLSLVTRAALRLRSKGIQFSGWSPDFFDEAFKSFDRQGNWNNIFCIYSPNESALSLAARNPANWTVTFGDTDGA
jgi:Acetyltransferase (GNAT) domain